MRSFGPRAGSAGAVVVVGEALVDVIEVDEQRTAVPGGSAANVALGLARRAIQVRLSTYLGPDRNGDLVAEHLTRDGVILASDSRAAPRTSTALAHREPSGNVHYTFDVDWRPRRIDVPPGAAGFHLGSFPGFSVTECALPETVARLRRNVMTSFDPNIRPAIIADADAARARFRQIAATIDLLKLSDEDAGYLLPGLSPDDILDELLALGVRLAAVTMGGDGMLLATPAARCRVAAPRVAIADTIGAGDTVMSALIADLVEGRFVFDEHRREGGDAAHDLRVIGERAVAAAAITVSRAGADLPRASELDA